MEVKNEAACVALGPDDNDDAHIRDAGGIENAHCARALWLGIVMIHTKASCAQRVKTHHEKGGEPLSCVRAPRPRTSHRTEQKRGHVCRCWLLWLLAAATIKKLKGKHHCTEKQERTRGWPQTKKLSRFCKCGPRNRAPRTPSGDGVRAALLFSLIVLAGAQYCVCGGVPQGTTRTRFGGGSHVGEGHCMLVDVTDDGKACVCVRRTRHSLLHSSFLVRCVRVSASHAAHCSFSVCGVVARQRHVSANTGWSVLGAAAAPSGASGLGLALGRCRCCP